MSADAGSRQEFQKLVLGELFGSLNEAPEEDQGRILKSFLLGSIDTMKEHSLFQLDLVEKLAFIALDNVQDVRLLSLEARVTELERGKPMTFGQIMGELFFALAVEAAIFSLVTYAGPVAAGSALLLANLRSTVMRPTTTVRALPIVRSFQANRVVKEMREELIGQGDRLLGQLHAPMPNVPAGAAWKRARLDRKQADAVVKEQLAHVRRQITNLDANREFQVARVLDAMPLPEPLEPRFTAIDAKRWSGKVKKFIDDNPHFIDGSKSEFRAFSLLALKQYPQAFSSKEFASQEVADAFTTTGATLEMVRECEGLKLQVALHYARMRAIQDAVPDDQIFDAFETVMVLEDVVENLLDLMDLSDSMLANLPGHVVPMEIAVWLLYLRASGALTRDDASRRVTVSGPVSDAAQRRFVGTGVATKFVSATPQLTDSPRATYEVRDYPGLGVLDEHQAYYLFHRFANPAFERFSDKVPKSSGKELGDFIHRDVGSGAFTRVLDMQKVFFFTGENQERVNLIKEMGVVVIEFFLFVEGAIRTRKAVGFSGAVAEGTSIGHLLDAIEAPTLSELPPESLPNFTAEEWLAEQAVAEQLHWEELALARLTSLEIAYDTALARFEHHTAMRALYLEATPAGFFDDVILGPASVELASARASVGAEIQAIREDVRYRSETVDERVDLLEVKVFRSPVERPETTLFSP